MKSILLIILLALSACDLDLGIRQMGASEYAVVYRKLPPILGGGLASSVKHPGEMTFIWPWESLFRFDTKIKSLEWGMIGAGSAPGVSDYVQTRALDGNEVSLAVRVEYSISKEPQKILYLIQNVGTSNQDVAQLVEIAARADIRTQMNKLRTSEFFNNEAKYRGEAEIKEAMQKRLGSYGIIIESVNLKEHRFERVLQDGTIDSSYQNKINEVQAIDEQTKREKLRIATIAADKQREFNNTQAEVNRTLAEAEGYRQQVKLQSEGYFESKRNESESIRVSGLAEVEALNKQVEALSLPGADKLLRLELVKELLKSNPKFVVLGKSSNNNLNVNRLDANELLEQAGVVEALKEEGNKNEKEK